MRLLIIAGIVILIIVIVGASREEGGDLTVSKQHAVAPADMHLLSRARHFLYAA